MGVGGRGGEARPPVHLTCSNLPQAQVDCLSRVAAAVSCLFPLPSSLRSVQLTMAQINQDKIFSPLAPVAVPREIELQTSQAFQPPSTANRASKLLPIISKGVRIR